MDRENISPRPDREWETPAFEEVSVSAEVTAYVGVRDLDGE
ncbi:MAG TPA: pyrroloquinoline quinone precursor peptide PqqA [Mycobacteriales bacterium]|nr:pyrroloquinoline quinone precursor peptide PqqA [Mycobacteriales bacterium]